MSSRGAGLSLQLRVRWVQVCENQINKPTGPVGYCCGEGWVQPLAVNKILHLSELETGGVHKSTRATPGSFTVINYS